MYIGKYLIRFRIALRMSQKTIGQFVKKHQTTISRIESDILEVRMADIPLYAAAVGLTVEEFLQNEGGAPSHKATGDQAGNPGDPALLHAKEEVIAAKNELIAVQQAHIEHLEKELGRLKGNRKS
jgi:transcriptional regulator with XRE-family HTH domain